MFSNRRAAHALPLLALVAALHATACSGGNFSIAEVTDSEATDGGAGEDASQVDSKADSTTSEASPPDSSESDSSVADTTVADTTVADTTVADTFVADTFVADTFVADTFVADTFVADTFVADTFVADTFVADTFVADTFVADTKPADAVVADGPVCPAPPSTKTWDLGMLTCSEIQTKLVTAVGDAKRCSCDADCSHILPRNVCGCGTFANPATDAYPLAKSLMERWTKQACLTICPDVLCIEPTSAACVPDPLGGAFKVCKDKSGGAI